MKTETIYLLKPYEKTATAVVLESHKENDSVRVLLNKTIFYPMGGGQPTDQGKITKADGSTLEVFQVQVKDGEIWHYIKGGTCVAGEELKLEIDWERRYKNMKIHSAGHITDAALVKLGYVPNRLSPLKADHGKKPFIVYKILDDSLKQFDLEELAKVIEREANFMIEQELRISWDFTTLDELKKTAVYLQPNLPENKPLRRLTIDTVGSFADGGTIVENAKEIEKIHITELRITNDELQIYYSIDAVVNSEGKRKSESKADSLQPSENVKEYIDFESIIKSAQDSLTSSKTIEEATAVWRDYLGKDGKVTVLMKGITEVPSELKKEFGITINYLKERITTDVEDFKNKLNEGASSQYLLKPQGELSFAKPKIGHLHPLTQTTNDLNEIFRKLGFSIMDGPEIETDEYCFQRLNLPQDHPARDLQDSIFIEEPNILLRTQTSSIEARVIQHFKPPYKVVMPGRVYRNEKVNKSNHFTFHQYQLTVVKEQVSMAELFSVINYMFKTFLGEETEIRFRCKYYPEVEPGVGPDMKCFNCHGEGCPVCKGRGWLEMGGAGIIHPNVLKMGGLDPNQWQGYAFGMGLDRWAMAKHKITDIRTLLGGNLAYKPN
jgi:phenylalanyl-tRNA synthetase alpha chain